MVSFETAKTVQKRFKEWRRSFRPRLVAQTDSLAEVRPFAGWEQSFIASAGRGQAHAALEGEQATGLEHEPLNYWMAHF